MKTKHRGRWIIPCLLLLALPLAAEGPRVFALTGARVVVGPGEVLENATVVLRDGVIESVGAGIEPPADAQIRELADRTIYAGLIDSYTERSWPVSDDESLAPSGGHPNNLVHPEREMLLHAGDESAARKLREAGFTSAVVAPEQGLFRGVSVLVNLGDGPVNDNVLRERVAHNVSLATNSFRGGYPSSLMGAVALFRQTLLDARWYAEAQAAYEANPAQPRPRASTALAALAGVAGGNRPVVLEARDVQDELRLAGLADEFELTATLVGTGKEYQWLQEIVATGMTIILPVDFPDAPASGEEDDLSVGLEELRHWDDAPGNPARLIDAGLVVAFTTHRLDDPRTIHTALARAIERGGLTADQALAALTTVPAAMLGIAERAGTVAAGRMANLVVTEGDLFVEDPAIREVWVDGRRYEVKESKPAEIEPAGEWDYVVESGNDEKITGTLTLEGEAAALSGTITVMGGTLPLASAEVSGKSLEVRFDGTPLGMPGMIVFTVEISGDSARGSGQSPDGPFTITGRRKSGPADPEETP